MTTTPQPTPRRVEYIEEITDPTSGETLVITAATEEELDRKVEQALGPTQT